jgi:rhodanese-related sulfurtransferase
LHKGAILKALLYTPSFISRCKQMIEKYVGFLTLHPKLVGAFLAAGVALGVNEWVLGKRAVLEITPEAAIDWMNQHAALIWDYRPKADFQAGHILGAVSISDVELQNLSTQHQSAIGRPIIIIGRTAGEMQAKGQQLRRQGLQAVILKGGMDSWRGAGLPLVQE